jgi:hypothetical protein
MKNLRFLFFVIIIPLILLISGCKWTILCVTGPKCASTGETVTIYIEGTCESEENSPTQYGLILQIPSSWLVLSAKATVGGISYNLTEHAEYASLYTPELGQKIWVGTTTEGSDSTENGIATVVLSIGDNGGQIKAAAGSYRDGAWTTDDPAGEFNFVNITEQKYIHSISTADTCIPALPPTPTSVSPSSGSSNGGTEITVHGSDFANGSVAGVTIGGNWISYHNITYATDGTWLRFNTPIHSAGAVDVTVRNPDGQEGTLTDGYTYVAASPPSVTSVSPDSGSSNGGTEVIVFGSDFAKGGDAGIMIGGNWISYSNITYAADGNWLQLSTPAHAAGAVDVTVRNPDGQEGTLSNGYTYIADSPPTVTSVSPVSGGSNGGTEVTAYGTNFVDGSGARVIIGGNYIYSWNITYGSDGTWLNFNTPAHAAGAVDIIVRNPDAQEGTLSNGYTYVADLPPSVTSVSPDSGSSNGGTEVTVYGSNFVDGYGSGVTIGGNWISYYNIIYGTDGTWLRFNTPAHAAGAVDIIVRNPDAQEGTLSNGYTYVADLPPSVTSVSPDSGSSNGGTEVTVYGSNFVDGSDARVIIGGNYIYSWNITYGSDGTWLRFNTPAHAAGTVDVTVRNPDGQEGTLSNGYTYVSTPTVTTTAASNIAYSSATSGGEVTSDGSSAVTERGVCWSTAPNPTTSNETTSNGTGTGSFTSLITGLSPSTKYYVKAYAINSEGTAYGNEVSFTTSATTPTLTTKAVSSITTNSAASGGNVSSDGGASVIARGVCWSTSSNPNTDDQATMNGQGVGEFTSTIAGLNPGTTYYVRAYAINSEGTDYGNEVSFMTSHASTHYVCSDGICGDNTPCHKALSEAMTSASSGTLILIAGEEHDGSFSLDADKDLTLQGGWDETFNNPNAGTTTLKGAPKAPQGSLIFQNLRIVP